MKRTYLVNLALIILAFSITSNCQNQTVSRASKTTNSNSGANSNISRITSDIPKPQTIKFESADKVIIIGTFYQSAKADSPAVLLLHQFRDNRKSFDAFAEHMQLKGFGVLTIDGRGFGESVKTSEGESVSAHRTPDGVKGMLADVGSAFEFLAKQQNVDGARIGIVGASYGSNLALIYGAKNKTVKAVALLSPGLGYLDGNLPSEPSAKNFGDRALLLVAAQDDRASAKTVRKLKEFGEKYETRIYKKAGHGTDIFDAKVGLEGLLEEFLKKSLS